MEHVTIARWLSIVFHPFVMVGVMVGAAAAARQTAGEAVRSVGIVVLFTIVPLAVLMWRQVRRGQWENVDASNRGERPILYIVGGAGVLALLAYVVVIRQQSFMVRGVVATLGMMALSAAATRWVKVSLHMAFAALAATALALARSPIGYAAAACAAGARVVSACPAASHAARGGPRHDHRRRRGGRTAFPVTGEQVLIRRGSLSDEPEFLAAVDRSRRLHHPWVQPPNTPAAYRDYLSKHQEPHGIAFFIWLEASRGLVGVVNVSEIVQGCFRSAYLGYYAFVPFAGRGLMKEGLAQVITHAFQVTKLHRLEANIQPANRASKALVKKLGFRREGLSPRYLKINGRWRDHERWAILSEDW